MSNTPILFLIFNRPDKTQLVFNEIRKLQPKQLFVSADGPRKDHPEDKNLCDLTRKIIDQVDWDCELHELFRYKNFGCKEAVYSAIDWFFNNVEEGIILEDDCVPDESFFPYCEELLEKYRNDEKVMLISGYNPLPKTSQQSRSYYFSRCYYMWGWATWRRVWKQYDPDILDWPQLKKEGAIHKHLDDPKRAKGYSQIFDIAYAGMVDTWDYQFVYLLCFKDGLSIMPRVNLVLNTGFGDTATHTKKGQGIPSNTLTFPLIHPTEIKRNIIADAIQENEEKSLYRRVKRKVRSSLNGLGF